MSELADLILHRFVERRDVYAVQKADGSYAPRQEPLTVRQVEDHLEGVTTIGHYVVSPAGMARVIAFDIDLTTEGEYREVKSYGSIDAMPCNPREVWLTPEHPGIPLLTIQLHAAATAIGRRLQSLTGCPVVATNSGGKGLHVYAFTGSQPAELLRRIAKTVMASAEIVTDEPEFVEGPRGYLPTRSPNYQVEVFPKQDTIREGGYGNLLRLPLGINRRTGRPGHVIYRDGDTTRLVRGNPLILLSEGDEW